MSERYPLSRLRERRYRKRAEQIASRAVRMSELGVLDKQIKPLGNFSILGALGIERHFSDGIFQRANAILEDQGLVVEPHTRYFPIEDKTGQFMIVHRVETEAPSD